jgi:hypothetical protein
VQKGLAEAGSEEARRISILIQRAIGQNRSRGTANTGAHAFRDGLEAAGPTIDKVWRDLINLLVKRLAEDGGK